VAQQRSPTMEFIKAVLTWHGVGACFGAAGLGVAAFTGTIGRTNMGEVLAGTMSMTVAGLFAALVFTPLAFLVLVGWAALVRRVPWLERGRLAYRVAKLSVMALLLTVPIALAMWMLLGMRATGESRPAIVVVLSTLSGDWLAVLMYLPAALGWFVLPRVVVASLRTPILGRTTPRAVSSRGHR
jgi:hypothetical protein